MKISQFRKFIRIHWVILALLLAGVAWLGKPEKVATAQTTEQRFALPTVWVRELTMGQGWGPEYPRMLADVNGDKKQDIVGFGIHGTWLAIAPPPSPANFVLKDFGYETGWRADLHVRTMGDVDGDEMDDIVGFGNDGVFRALSTGSGFGTVDYVVADFGYNQGWRNDKHVRLLADINGDTRKDILAFGEHGVWASIAMKSGEFSAPFFAVGDFGYLQGWRNERHIRTTADLNGDKMQDIVGFGEYGVWIALANGNGFNSPQLVLTEFAIQGGGWQVTRHPRMMADINNDTFDDIIGFGDDGVWISLSTGGAFSAPQLVIEDFGYNDGWRVNLHPRYIADLNGDGYKDIVGYGQESVYRSLNGPNGFPNSIRGVLRELVAADYPYSESDPGWAPRYVGDVTGDGMADLVAFGETHIWVAKSSDQPPLAPPNAPTNLRIQSTTETSMVVAWDDNSSDERRFFTYFGEPNILTRTIRPADTEQATYTSLEPDTRYCFTVEAENIWGVSGTPSTVCGRTKPEPQPTPTPTPEPLGFSKIAVFNCNSEQRAVTVWTLDHSTNVWTQHGTVPSMWANGSCPAQSTPFQVPLPNLHAVTFVAVDPGLLGCGQNNPQIPFCQRSKLQLFGKATGPVLPHTVN